MGAVSEYRVLVCGDRHWQDAEMVTNYLDDLLEQYPGLVVIEGCAPGADRAAHDWRKPEAEHHAHFPADWGRYHKAAGPLRNQAMLKAKPDE